jgi:hypothetical protein
MKTVKTQNQGIEILLMNVPLIKAPGNTSQLHIRFIPASSHSDPRLVRKTFLKTILAVAISVLAPVVAHADSATWNLNPISGDWNTAPNWTPATVPNGPADTATFALSNTTGVSISADTEVNGIIFTPAATNSYYIDTFENTLTLSGTGITNNSGIAQYLSSGSPPNGSLQFSNSSTAGSANITNGSTMSFSNTSTAGLAHRQRSTESLWGVGGCYPCPGQKKFFLGAACLLRRERDDLLAASHGCEFPIPFRLLRLNQLSIMLENEVAVGVSKFQRE